MSMGDVWLRLGLEGTQIEVDARKQGAKAGDAFSATFKAKAKDLFKGGLIAGAGAATAIAGVNAVKGAISGVGDTVLDSVQKALSFERAMLNINSIAKVSGAQLDAMGKTLLRMSGEFGQSADTMTTALYNISSSGFAGAEGIDVLRAAAKAATAGLATTDEAASGITAVLNAYGLSASSAGAVSDILFKTVERGVVTFPELSAEIGKTTALAAPLGVSLEEVGAALSVMTRHGLAAEDATTQLNAIMASMLKPSKEAADLAQRLGIDWTAAGLKANGLAGSLTQMIQKTGGSEESMAILLGDVRAIRGAFTLAAQSGGELNAELAIMEKSSGATESAFGIQSQGAAFKMAQATARLDAALTNLGRVTLPLVAGAAETLSFALDRTSVPLDRMKEAATRGSQAAAGQFRLLEHEAERLGITVEEAWIRMNEGTLDAADEMAAAMSDISNFPGKMADDIAGSSIAITGAFGSVGAGATGMARELAAASISGAQVVENMKDKIIASAREILDGAYRVLTAGDELSATNAEITAKRRIIASGAASSATDRQTEALQRQMDAEKRHDDASETVFQRTMKRIASEYSARIDSLDLAEKELAIADRQRDLNDQLNEAQLDLAKAQQGGPGGVNAQDVSGAMARVADIQAQQAENERKLAVDAQRDRLVATQSYIEDVAKLEAQSDNKKALAANLATRKAALRGQLALAETAKDADATADLNAKLEAIKTAEARTAAAQRSQDRQGELGNLKAQLEEQRRAMGANNAAEVADAKAALIPLYQTQADLVLELAKAGKAGSGAVADALVDMKTRLTTATGEERTAIEATIKALEDLQKQAERTFFWTAGGVSVPRPSGAAGGPQARDSGPSGPSVPGSRSTIVPMSGFTGGRPLELTNIIQLDSREIARSTSRIQAEEFNR